MKPNNRSQYCIRNVIAPPTPQKAIAISTSLNSDRPPTSQKRSPSHISKQRSLSPHPKKRTACSSASLSPLTSPNSDRIYSQTWNGNEEMAITTI
ncbi:MAG: hypothetical protein PT116_23980 [Aphanizomenon gracile PMC638.10]|nr:hypothetical protein [Aphanizomenon gracile PMC638.10]